MATSTGSRTVGRIGAALVIVVVIALVATMCTSSDDPPVGSGPGGRPGTGEILALGLDGEPLSVRLSAGSALSQATPDPIRVVEGEPLDDDAVRTIFDRLPPWSPAATSPAAKSPGTRVSAVSAHPAVRRRMRALQRALATAGERHR